MHEGPYVTDLLHYLTPDGSLVTGGPAGRFAAFLGALVESATALPAGPRHRVGLPCPRRIARRPCEGVMLVRRDPEMAHLEWECSACTLLGVTRGWAGTLFDLSAAAIVADRADAGDALAITVTRAQILALRGAGLEHGAPRVAVARAVPVETDAFAIQAGHVVLADLMLDLASWREDAPRGRSSRLLRAVVEQIGVLLDETHEPAAAGPRASPAAAPTEAPTEAAARADVQEWLRCGTAAIEHSGLDVDAPQVLLFTRLLEAHRAATRIAAMTWPGLALETTLATIEALSPDKVCVQDEDELAWHLGQLALDAIDLSRSVGVPLEPGLERILDAHRGDDTGRLEAIVTCLAAAELTPAERDWLTRTVRRWRRR